MPNDVHARLGWIIAFVALLLLAVFAVPRIGRAQVPTPVTENVVRNVSVSGHGEVRAVPDQATITIGVLSQAPTADEALDENNSRMQALVQAIRNAGVESRDIQTSSFTISPVYEEPRVPVVEGTPEITGYQVSNQVTITVRSLGRLSTLLDEVVTAGANQIYGISFGFSDPQALMDQARAEAMADARHKATQLATLAESSLGQVITISEGGFVPPPIMVGAARLEMAQDVMSVPVEPGEAMVTVDVQVTYGLQ